MAVLYRKYRPQTFSQVLAQKPIVQTLKNQILAGSVAHAYLFTGSRGVGKTSVARILAKAVNCLHQRPTTPAADATTPPLSNFAKASSDLRKGGETAGGDACGVCENCKAISSGTFLDLIEVDAASNTGVDNIRELIEHVKFSPSSGKYKVFIIDEVHMLSKGAFNALLKTLEEPPKHAIFILATTEINKVPATIVSRTQRFDFKAYSPANLLELLVKVSAEEKINFGRDILELISETAEGSARDALSLLDKIMTLGDGASLEDCQKLLGVTDLKVCEDLLGLIASGKAGSMPGFFAELSQKGLDYLIFNRDFLEFLRKVLIYKVSEGKIDSGAGSHHAAKIQELADNFSSADLIFIIRLFLKSYKDLAVSPSQEIPMLLASIEASLKKSSAPTTPSAPAVAKAMADKSQTPLLKKEGNAPQLSEDIMRSSPPVEDPDRSVGAKEEYPATAGGGGINIPQVIIEAILVEKSEVINIITLEEAESLWPKVIVKIKAINGPLASMLKNAKPHSVEHGKIIVGVKFSFDKQSLESAKNSGLIVSVIEEVSGKRIGIGATVLKQEIAAVGSSAEVLSDALKVFGGELLE